MRKLAHTTTFAALAIALGSGGAIAQDETVELNMATPWAGGHWRLRHAIPATSMPA